MAHNSILFHIPLFLGFLVSTSEGDLSKMFHCVRSILNLKNKILWFSMRCCVKLCEYLLMSGNKYLKFVYSEKATKFCKISTLLLSTVHTDKSKVDILLNFAAFSEYMNFKMAVLIYPFSSIQFDHIYLRK